ncbi:MAG TPA: ATP synthase F1 subunit delta [bacterium]|jgi:F-type H+-transporting ATPase subunit delta|nr:ATP synthase F1 subunit delta [bacterium]
MLASLLAERYSKALLRAARAENALPKVGSQAATLREALAGAADSAAFLGDPLAEPGEKLRVLTSVFKDGGHPLLRGFLTAVLEHKRERFLPAILAAFGGLCDAAEGRLAASLGTARSLPAAERALLEASLSRSLKRTVTLEPYTDKALLGGAVLKLGDTVYDGSLRNGLIRLGRMLNEGPAPRAPKNPKPAQPKAPAKAKAKAKPKKAAKAAAKPAAAPKKKPASKKKTAKKGKP